MCVCSFGLLGASGCGKTTLLRCILSSLDPDYGEITVLGLEPGITQSRVPGRDIGYMPQVRHVVCATLWCCLVSMSRDVIVISLINFVQMC